MLAAMKVQNKYEFRSMAHIPKTRHNVGVHLVGQRVSFLRCYKAILTICDKTYVVKK